MRHNLVGDEDTAPPAPIEDQARRPAFRAANEPDHATAW
jgi:hypothetical protein